MTSPTRSFARATRGSARALLLSAAPLAAWALPIAATAPSADAALPAPPPSIVSSSLQEPCVDFARRPLAKDGPAVAAPEPLTSRYADSGAELITAVAANAGDRRAAAQVRRQVRNWVNPGRPCALQIFNTASSEPTAAGGVTAQNELPASAVLLIAKHSPLVWKKLTKGERRNADLIMRGQLISNAFITGDGNPRIAAKAESTIDGDRNVGRDFNPNFREGMLGNVLMGVAYFGTKRAKRELAGWNRQKFIADTTAAGLTNLATTFNWAYTHPGLGAPSDQDIAAALTNWAYHGIRLTQVMTLVGNLTAFTYDQAVACGGNGGAGVQVGKIVAGRLADPNQCGQLANLGQPGMLHELNARDAGGLRSSVPYAYLGFKANLATHVAMLSAGAWKRGSAGGGRTTAQLTRLKRVGITDLFKKLELGYINYSKGEIELAAGYPKGAYIQKLSIPAGYRNGYIYQRSLWEDVALRSKVVRRDRG